MGCIMSPRRHIQVLTPGTCEYALSGNWDFADIISDDDIMRKSGGPMTGVLIKRKQRHGGHRERRPCDDRAEMAAASQGTELEGTRKKPPLPGPSELVQPYPQLTSYFWRQTEGVTLVFSATQFVEICFSSHGTNMGQFMKHCHTIVIFLLCTGCPS